MNEPRTVDERWFSWRVERPSAPVRLFCFPFAGGSAAAYRTWPSSLPATIDVVPVELPGHGRRYAEQALAKWAPLLDGLQAALAPLFDRPFAFFGHSMGGRVAFELARLQRRTDGPLPRGLFLSGANAPHAARIGPARHLLPRAELVETLRGMGGTPAAVLDSEEMLDFFLPMLRADFELVDGAVYSPEEKLDLPFTLFAGLRDPAAPLANVEAWREHTTREPVLHTLDAAHHFLDAERGSLLREIEKDLPRWLEASP